MACLLGFLMGNIAVFLFIGTLLLYLPDYEVYFQNQVRLFGL